MGFSVDDMLLGKIKSNEMELLVSKIISDQYRICVNGSRNICQIDEFYDKSRTITV